MEKAKCYSLGRSKGTWFPKLHRSAPAIVLADNVMVSWAKNSGQLKKEQALSSLLR